MEAVDTRARVVAVIGSPRRGANSELLVEAAVAEIEARGVPCEVVRLAELSVTPCLGHDDCGTRRSCPLKDDAEAVLAAMFAADGLILASPVYFQNVTAQLKALIDRSVFRYNRAVRLRARVVGLLAVAEDGGIEDTFDAMRRFVALSSDRDIPALTAGGFANLAGSAAENEELMAAARRLGRELAEALA